MTVFVQTPMEALLFRFVSRSMSALRSRILQVRYSFPFILNNFCATCNAFVVVVLAVFVSAVLHVFLLFIASDCDIRDVKCSIQPTTSSSTNQHSALAALGQSQSTTQLVSANNNIG